MKTGLSISLLILSLAVILTAACQKAQVPATESNATRATPEAMAAASSSPSSTPTIPAQLKPVEFTDVTTQAGIKFRHNNGAFGNKYLPETTGSGCAFRDYDNDGWQDVLLINSMDFEGADQSGKKPRRSVMALYHNNQNGMFADVTASAGLAKPMYGIGAAIGDYDNDGWQDIYVTALGANALFRNLGSGKFADVTTK